MLVDPEVDHESVARGRWWETKLSVVDWSVPAPLQLKRRRYWRKHSPIQPPHYHDLLLRPSFPSRGRYGAMATKTTTPGPATLTVTAVDHGNHTSLGVEEVDKESWNDGLIGVRMAEDALQQFETDVGFHYSIMPDVVLQEFLTRHLDVGSEVTNEDLDKIRDIWLHRLHELVGEYVVPERPALKLDEDFRPRSIILKCACSSPRLLPDLRSSRSPSLSLLVRPPLPPPALFMLRNSRTGVRDPLPPLHVGHLYPRRHLGPRRHPTLCSQRST
ncbi:hypothetical protein CONPUDRAFT_166017, partial [Coniophora puteana RWD-64-598 SS2]